MNELILKVSANTHDLERLEVLERRLEAVLNKPSAVALQKQAAAGTATASAEYKKLQAELAAAQKQAAGLTAQVAQLTAAQTKATESSVALRSALRGVGGAAGALWLTYARDLIPMMVAFAAASAVIKGSKLSAEFEYNTKFAHTLATATGDASLSLKDLRQNILGLRETVHTPQQLALAHKELVKAGFESAAALRELDEVSIAAAVAEEDLGLVATVAAAQYRAWNVEVVGAARGVRSINEVLNEMAFATANAAFEWKDLLPLLKHVSPLATLSGVALHEVLGGLGTLHNMGIVGTTSATALTQAVLRLQNPTEKLKKELRELGLSFDFLDQKTGKAKNLQAMFTSLGDSLRKLPTVKQRVQLMADFFNIRSLKASGLVEAFQHIAENISTAKFNIVELSDGIKQAGEEGVFLTKVWAGFADTATKQTELLQADLARTLTESFNSEATKELVKSLRDFVNDGTLSSLIRGLGKVVETTIEWRSELATLAKAWVAGKVIKSISGGVTLALEGATAAQVAFNAVTKLNPYLFAGGAAIVLGQWAYDMGLLTHAAMDGAVSWRDLITASAEGRQKLLTDLKKAVDHEAKLVALREKYEALTQAPPVFGTEGARKQAVEAGIKVPGEGPADTTLKVAGKFYDDYVAIALNAAKRSEAATKQTASNELALLKANFSARLLSESEYYSQSAVLEDRQAAARLATLKEEREHRDRLLRNIQKKNAAVLEPGFQSPGDTQAEVTAAKKAVAVAREALEDADNQIAVEQDRIRGAIEKRRRESNLRFVALERDRATASVEAIKTGSALELQATEAALKNEQTLLDAYRSQSRISETDHWDATRDIQRRGMEAGIKDLEQQLLAAKMVQLAALVELRRVGSTPELEQNFRASKVAVDSLGQAIDIATAALKNHIRVTGETKVDTEDWVGGARAGLRSYADEAANVHQQASQAAIKAFGQMEDALISYTQTGKINFRDMANSIISDISRIMIRKSISEPIARGIGSFFEGFKFPGFATGGDFQVGGSGGTDSQLVAFKATPNERVSVRTPQQVAKQVESSQPSVHVTYAPVIQAIDTQTGLQFLVGHSRIITGIINKGLQKQGKKGIPA